MKKMIGAMVNFKNLTTILLGGLFFLSITTSIALSQDLMPAINIQPGTSVEVGEEVLLSATGTVYPDKSILAKARYEWDFGDGYKFCFDPVKTYITQSGIAVTHFFMRPGDFTVTLTVTIWPEWDYLGNPVGNPLASESTTKIIHVTGEAPMAGFEIQRASFHNRLAQYLYVQIPEAFRGNQTSLKVTLQGDSGSSNILLSKNNLTGEEVVLLDHNPLVQDNYVVIAELFDNSGKRISGGLWRDKFSKRYSGVPKIAIDENNSLRVNGEFFFPIGNFLTRPSSIENFKNQANINMLHTQGYSTTYTPSTWSNYLQQASNHNLLSTGPGVGDYQVSSEYWSPSPVNRWKFNHNPDRIAEYVQQNKDDPTMFSWLWLDEPNLGDRKQKVYPPVYAAWSYATHREDPHHLVYNLFVGYDWTRYYQVQPNDFDYLASASLFGGKKWLQDILSFDIYPLPYRLSAHLNFADIGPYGIFLEAVDRAISNNKNLVPYISVLMPNPKVAGETVLLVSADQVYMEAWMSVVHGAKGITWFPFFDYDNIRYDAMKKFADQMKVLAPVVLQPESNHTVVTDANTALNRVDSMIREYNGSLYVFAVRITEPDPVEGSKYLSVEPESITANFSVSGLSGNALAEVMDEGRQVSLSNGQFTDKFARNAVHIYKIAKDGEISKEGDSPKYLRIIN